MKRIIIAALCITVVATLTFAQEPPHRMFLHKMDAEVAASLGLSADQKTQWDAIHQQLAASAGPLQEQIGSAERQLHALASTSNPDATAVGRQFLAMFALQQQMRATHDATKQKIDAILTPDQKTKLEAMHAQMEHGPMMMRHPEPGSRD